MMRRAARVLLATGLLVVVAAVLATPVFAYDEAGRGGECIDCHGVASPTEVTGPHGGYMTTTNKCKTCHDVHAAPAGGRLLLPAATVKATCFTCHDGSGGLGVYGAIDAQALTVEAEHSIDTTDTVPGGNRSTGGDATFTFAGENDFLTCSDCHSPHASTTVNDFTRERVRSDTSTINVTASNRLLRSRPNGIGYDIEEYGSDWCGACHQGRLTFGSGVNNHPVESTATTDYYFYENVARLTTTGVTTVETGTLGANNLGFVMPYPRDTLQNNHYPICMQCHEDSRDVGDVTIGELDTTEVFTVTDSDGKTAGDNPRFQTFPHESTNANFLVETNDDLCTNCHDPIGQLP